MKLIKAGRKQDGWACEQVCSGLGHGTGGCGAVLLVEEDDLFASIVKTQQGECHWMTFRCNQCGVHTDLFPPHIVLPSFVTDKALKRKVPTR